MVGIYEINVINLQIYYKGRHRLVFVLATTN